MSFVKAGIDEYLSRLQRYIKVSWEELPDVKNGGKLDHMALKEKECELIFSKVTKYDTLVLLDEGGQQYSSVDFSKWLEKQMLHLNGDLCFIIGGAYGFSERVYAETSYKISLSQMTFSHQIIRAIFAEQLYRAFTIQRGEPYHHA